MSPILLYAAIKCGIQSASHNICRRSILNFEEDHKFVAPYSGEEVFLADHLLDASCKVLKRLITRFVPQSIIDTFQPIDVCKHQDSYTACIGIR